MFVEECLIPDFSFEKKFKFEIWQVLSVLVVVVIHLSQYNIYMVVIMSHVISGDVTILM